MRHLANRECARVSVPAVAQTVTLATIPLRRRRHAQTVMLGGVVRPQQTTQRAIRAPGRPAVGRARLPIERWLRWLQRCDMRLRYALLGLRDRARGCQHEGLRQLRGLRRQHTRAGDLAARLYRMRFGRASRVVRDRQHAEAVGSMVASDSACAEWRPNSAPTEPPTAPLADTRRSAESLQMFGNFSDSESISEGVHWLECDACFGLVQHSSLRKLHSVRHIAVHRLRNCRVQYANYLAGTYASSGRAADASIARRDSAQVKMSRTRWVAISTARAVQRSRHHRV